MPIEQVPEVEADELVEENEDDHEVPADLLDLYVALEAQEAGLL